MITAATDLYCIFGHPVGHSKSPVIHNALFRHHKVDAAYLAFDITDISKGVAAMKTLGIKGASVTIPHKEDVMKHLDHIDDDAVEMNAVNTIVNRKGKLFGCNTDSLAAVEPLASFGIKGRRVVLVGAGGAAKAVAYGLHQNGGLLTIVNRNRQRGQRLAQKYHAGFIPQDELACMDDIDADIIINTTPVGMHPDIDGMAFPERFLKPEMVVMDVVYAPLKTRLLKEAETRGCRIVDGLEMFLHQGAAQFKLWTGISPDMVTMRTAVLNGGN